MFFLYRRRLTGTPIFTSLIHLIMITYLFFYYCNLLKHGHFRVKALNKDCEVVERGDVSGFIFRSRSIPIWFFRLFMPISAQMKSKRRGGFV